MHLQGLDLNLLIALDALLSEKNVTRAAERIHISQPGMSAALQKLRHYFDDPILERVGRGMELTNRIKPLAEPVKSILAQIRELGGQSKTFDPAVSDRVFRISATTYCSQLLAAPLMRALRHAAPRISVQFEELSTDTARRLSDGQIDFAITITARIIADLDTRNDTLLSRALFTDSFVVAMSRDNPFDGEIISFDEFCRMPYIETRFAGVFAGVSEQLLRQQTRQPHICGWLPNFQLTAETVGQTDTITILPSLVTLGKEESYNLRTIPVPFDMPMLEEQLFWHRRNDDDPGYRWIAELLQKQVQQTLNPNWDKVSPID